MRFLEFKNFGIIGLDVLRVYSFGSLLLESDFRITDFDEIFKSLQLYSIFELHCNLTHCFQLKSMLNSVVFPHPPPYHYIFTSHSWQLGSFSFRDSNLVFLRRSSEEKSAPGSLLQGIL